MGQNAVVLKKCEARKHHVGVYFQQNGAKQRAKTLFQQQRAKSNHKKCYTKQLNIASPSKVGNCDSSNYEM